MEGVGETDDIDMLGNRRIRSVEELIQNQIPYRFKPVWKDFS